MFAVGCFGFYICLTWMALVFIVLSDILQQRMFNTTISVVVDKNDRHFGFGDTTTTTSDRSSRRRRRCREEVVGETNVGGGSSGYD